MDFLLQFVGKIHSMDFLLQFVGKIHSMVFFGSQWISCCKLLEKQSSIVFFCSQQVPCCNLLESKGSICLLLTTVVSFAICGERLTVAFAGKKLHGLSHNTGDSIDSK
jgi:hypothetical protein